MDSNYFESALNSLSKTQHKRRLLQILMVIKKGTIGSQQITNVCKLQRKGSLKYLIGCLNSDSSTIVDITLSILGNIFCVSSNCCYESIQKFHILSHLSDILDKYNADSIRGRLFRIVGNIKNLDIACITKISKSNLINKIVTFLDNYSTDSNSNDISEATMSMAIRSLRKFITNDTIHTFICDYDSLRVIGQVLLKSTSNWEKNKTQKLIIEDILRLLLVFSKYQYANSVIKLRTAKTGDPMVALCNLVVLYPSRVLKIIFNFATCVLAKTDIPIKTLAENLIQEMKVVDINNGIKDETLFKEYLRALCDLLKYPIYRIDAKNAGGVLLLMDLLEKMLLPSNFNFECCHLILTTFVVSRFDESVMTHENCSLLVKLMIHKLKWIINETTIVNTSELLNADLFKRNSRRKCNILADECKRSRYDFSNESVCLSPDPWPSDDSSPERSVSPCSSSDISTNPNSPNYVLNPNEELSDSDNYSPICSDNEESETLPPHGDDYAASDPEDLYKKAEFPFCKRSYNLYIREDIHVLLKWFLKLQPPIHEMVNESLLNLLINDIFSSAYPTKSYDLLLKIFSVQEYLIPILLTDIIPKLYKVKAYINEMCSLSRTEQISKIIAQLTSLAESPCGKGAIAHQLFRANIDIKQQIIIKLPYIIRNRTALSKLMLNCGGLNILLKLLNDDLSIQNKSLKALYLLALQLQIRESVPQHVRMTRSMFNIDKYELLHDSENIVIFILDDGEKVSANRSFLSDQSEYFHVLLYGDFKESKKAEIELHNVSSKSLKYLISLLQHDITQYKQHFDLNLDLEIVLDIIELAEQYLLFDIGVYLTNSVEQFYFSSKNIPIIYKWSIESWTNRLRIEAMAYALVGNIGDSERLQIFQEFFSFGLGEYIIEDVKTLLIRFLK